MNQFQTKNDSKRAEELEKQMQALQIQVQENNIEITQTQAQIDQANQLLIDQQREHELAMASMQQTKMLIEPETHIICGRRRPFFGLF